MAQLTWEAMNPIDTSRYLDAIQKAQAQSVAGVEQIGNAYKGYYDNLSKQNTNDMLTALNQAQNPEQLAAAQENIAAMQQRWGSGYDMDAVRTAVDERPAVLNERASQALKYQQEKALHEAYPQINAAAAKFAAGRKGVTPEMAQELNALAALGIDSSGYINSLATSANTDFTTERTYTTGREDRKEDLKIAKEAREQAQRNWQADYDYREDESNWKRADTITKDYPKENTLSFQDGKWVTITNPGISRMDAYGALSGVRGIRNNNPGNIEFYNQPGASLESKGGRFARFSTPEQGINAMSKQLDLYFTGKSRNVTKPINTIQDIITTWAPPKNKKGQVENNTPAYIAAVAKAMGVSPTAKLNLNDPNTKAALMSAMITQENGSNPYTREQYIAGITGNTAGNTPATAPLVGIDRKVQQKIRGDYQKAMLKYNEKLALADQPVNVGNVLAGLTAKEKGSKITQDSFDIVNALKDNPQLKGLSAEGITNVYNRAKAWQSKPGGFFELYNSSNGLNKSIDNIIKDELKVDAQRKAHVAKASHPSNEYAQKIQQEFEANGVSISAKEALLHIDPARYEALHGKPTVKVQEALEKDVEKVAAKATPAATAATPKPTPQKQSKAFIPFATPTPVTSMKPNAVSGAKATPAVATPKAESKPTPQKAVKPSKQDVVAFYVKRGEVGNVVPDGINPRTDRQLIREAQAEATKQLAAKEAKQKADAAVKKAAEKAEAARVSKEYDKRKSAQKANTSSQVKTMDVNQLRKAYANQQALSLSNAARKAKEEEARKRNSR